MAENKDISIHKKMAQLQALEAQLKQFVDEGGDLKSKEALPLGVEFVHAFDEVARELGCEILKPISSTETSSQQKEIKTDSESKPVADFLTLFTFTKKRELEKYCRELVIHSSAFVDFILACEFGNTPFLHKIHYQDHQPDHLQLTDADHAALSANGVGELLPEAQKAVGKIIQTFRERRYLVGHIFYVPDLSEWHFFQFDQRDLEDNDNHWKEGAHVHFINWLWPNQDAQSLWTSFTSSRAKMNNSLHVRYVDAARTRRQKGFQDRPASE